MKDERLKDGKMERWKDGKMEKWKMEVGLPWPPPLCRPDPLVLPVYLVVSSAAQPSTMAWTTDLIGSDDDP
ncbi:unnamed protein product [Prunus armeniaca]